MADLRVYSVEKSLVPGETQATHTDGPRHTGLGINPGQTDHFRYILRGRGMVRSTGLWTAKARNIELNSCSVRVVPRSYLVCCVSGEYR